MKLTKELKDYIDRKLGENLRKKLEGFNDQLKAAAIADAKESRANLVKVVSSKKFKDTVKACEELNVELKTVSSRSRFSVPCVVESDLIGDPEVGAPSFTLYGSRWNTNDVMITKSSINENSFYNFDGPRINAIKKEAAALHTKAVSDYYTITTMASIGDDIEDIKKLLAKYDIEL